MSNDTPPPDGSNPTPDAPNVDRSFVRRREEGEADASIIKAYSDGLAKLAEQQKAAEAFATGIADALWGENAPSTSGFEAYQSTGGQDDYKIWAKKHFIKQLTNNRGTFNEALNTFFAEHDATDKEKKSALKAIIDESLPEVLADHFQTYLASVEEASSPASNVTDMSPSRGDSPSQARQAIAQNIRIALFGGQERDRSPFP